MSTTAFDTRFPRSPTSSLSGVELLAKAIWYRSKVKVKGVLALRLSNPRTKHRQPRWFPPEITEMIIAHLIHDIPTLKACAATCFSWYNIAIPHIHHTLILHEWSSDASNEYWYPRPSPLRPLFKFGLLPFVKNLRIDRVGFTDPQSDRGSIFGSRSMVYFRAMVNLQDLSLAHLDLSKFPTGLGDYLGHFSPTLRSVALSWPKGTRNQLLGFFGLFPKLDNIGITGYATRQAVDLVDNCQLVPFNGGLRGRLTLSIFGDEELLKDIAVAFGGMRFTSMDLQSVRGMRSLLEVCADTLETVRIYPWDIFTCLYPRDFDLSSNTALRSVELLVDCDPLGGYTKQFLSTITSPVFSELIITFPESEIRACGESDRLARVIREFYEVKEFKVVFCLETSEKTRADNLHILETEIEKAVSEGRYDFLPCRPSIISRVLAKYDRHYLGF